MKVKHERLFAWFARDDQAQPNDAGRKQFKADQSEGIKPATPDAYYLRLSEGKRRYDLLVSQYHALWHSGEWWGTAQLESDWADNAWVLPHLLRWLR